MEIGMKNAKCEIDGCTARVWNKTEGRTLCGTHGVRLRKYGDPLAVSERYKRKVRWVHENVGYTGDDCLKWPFGVSDHGRGTVSVDNKTYSAPRYMCILAHGAPPSKQVHAAHSCGNGHLGCINPRHLSWKTAKENERDKVEHGTLRRGSEINTSKLSEDDVRAIRAMIGKASGVEIARAWQITAAMVSNIKLRKAWAWLD